MAVWRRVSTPFLFKQTKSKVKYKDLTPILFKDLTPILFEEAKTKKGKEMAREKWEKIQPELMKLMNLEPGQDPIKILGTPVVFQ